MVYNDTHLLKGTIMSEFSNQPIIEMLKERPGHVYIVPTGDRLYALTKDAEGRDKLLVLTSDKDLTKMTEEEVSTFIIQTLKSMS
jgi:hypothetical protein